MKSQRILDLLCILALMGLAVDSARAQTPFGAIVGTVTDSTGAVIPGVSVTASNLRTGEKRTFESDARGLYQFLNLPPANYRIEVERSGFKRFVREPVVVQVQATVRIDVTLEVGALTQVVEVTAPTPLLQPETSSLGEVINTRSVEDLPLNGRNPFALAALTPGVVPQNTAGMAAAATPNHHAWGNFQIGGALANQSEWRLDGAPLNAAQQNAVAIVPSGDAIQEFKVQTNNFSAEFGRTAGGIVNLYTKSGSNQFHGTVYEFFRNRVLNANTFFNNRAGVNRPPFSQNQFGATFGGPIRRDKTFFFTNYEGFRQRRGQSLTLTVPTAAQRAGDFSQTFNASGNLIPIYDPLTTCGRFGNPACAVDGNGNEIITRQQFPGNQIPSGRFDPVASNMLKFWALPTGPGTGPTGVNNWTGNASFPADSDEFIIRIDHIVSDKQRIFGRYNYSKTGFPAPGAFGTGVTISPGDVFRDFRKSQQAMIEDVYTFSPTTVLDVRASYTRLAFNRLPLSQGQDLTALGFPETYQNQISEEQRHVPIIAVSGFATIFGGGVFLRFDNMYSIEASLTKVSGRHSMKFGTELRLIQFNNGASNEPSGNFSFAPRFTTINPFAPAGSGYSFAEYLLGLPSSGAARLIARTTQNRLYRAWYFQDDFRVTPRLTLNLGVRYDQDGNWSEKYDREGVFLPFAEHPLSSQVQGVLGRPLLGVAVPVNSSAWPDRASEETRLDQWAPRFGFAFQAASKTVLRGGYGIFWLPNNLALAEASVGPMGQAATNFTSTLDGGITAAETLSNPFSVAGSIQLLQPIQPSDLTTVFTGGDAQIPAPGNSLNGYAQQWNFNIQHELPGGLLLDAAYAGLKGTGLPVRLYALNQLQPQHLSQGQALFTQVANPFAGLITSGALSRPTIPQGQLLLSYPHMVGVFPQPGNYGKSIYHSFQFKAQRRFGKGGTLLFAYTNSKLISDVESQTAYLEPQRVAFEFGPQNAWDRSAERSLSTFDTPQRLVTSYVVDLPFGTGQRWGSGLTGAGSKFISGWAVAGIYTAQVGFPVFVTNSQDLSGSYILRGGVGARPNLTGNPEFSGAAQSRLIQWFDTSDFSQPAAFTFGNAPRTLPNVRVHGVNNLDFSVVKNTTFGSDGRFNLQFRAEFFNLFNRVQFGPPGNSRGTSSFGVVGSQLNEPRLVQFALKFIF